MPQHEDCEPEVYALKPRSSDWALDPRRYDNWIKRFGFPLVPAFAATVHAVTGGQLPALIGEMDTFDATPSQEDALKGYIIMSRVESANNIAIAQPFSPSLFRQGKLQNAELLLEVLRGDVDKEDLKNRWEQIDKQQRQRKYKLEDQQWACGICLRLLPWTAYALEHDENQAAGIQRWILKPGSSRCCRKCLRGEARGDAAMPSQTYMCKVCKKTRAVKFFDKMRVSTLRDSDELEELSCVDCKGYEAVSYTHLTLPTTPYV